MEIHKTIIGLAIATVIVMGILVPYISSAVVSYDQDGSVLSFGSYGSDELDGWSLSASVTSSAVHITSTMWKGSVDGSTYLLVSDSGNIWYDGNIHTLMGDVYHTYTSLEVSIINGSLKIGSDNYPLSTVYVPSSKGTFGSHSNGSVNDPVFGVGSFAGITVSGNDQSITGNTSEYVLDGLVTTVDNRNSLEFSAGDYSPPVQTPPRQQAQSRPGMSLDVIEDMKGEYLDIIELEKGEITIVPGKEDLGDLELGGTSVIPGKLPASGLQAVGDPTSGTTGQCTWELDGTVLYIRGNGIMGTYSLSDYAPWGTAITKVVIEEGVTRLGAYSFYFCTELTEVIIANTVTWISAHCFHGCTALTTLTLPEGLTMINYSATQNCSSLKELICPETLSTFGASNLTECTSLTKVYIPQTVTSFNSQYGCTFVLSDGTNNGTMPTGGVFIRELNGVFYQSMNATVDNTGYILNWYGATVVSTENIPSIMIPYQVTTGDRTYTVKNIGAEAISGSAVRYVIIPQTVESVSNISITAPHIQQVLNLSNVEISSSGQVRTSVSAAVTLSELSPVYSPYRDVIQMVPLLLILGLVVVAVSYIGSRRL